MADNDQLGTLTDQMKGWQAGAADADLKVSTAGRDQYLKAIATLRQSLTEVQGKLTTLKTVGNPGTYQSATQTQKGLQDDATTLDDTITEYLAYLAAYEQTVKDACDRMIKSG
jgi:hypothetical protein